MKESQGMSPGESRSSPFFNFSSTENFHLNRTSDFVLDYSSTIECNKHFPVLSGRSRTVKVHFPVKSGWIELRTVWNNSA